MNCELRIQRDGVHVLGAQWLGTGVTETRNPPHQEKLYSCFLSTDFFPVMGLNICGLPTLWISAWQWAPANTAPQAKFSRLLGGIWCPNLNVKRSWGWHGHQPDLNGQQQRCSMSVFMWNSGADQRHTETVDSKDSIERMAALKQLSELLASKFCGTLV